MMEQLFIGAVVVVITVTIQAEMFALLWRNFDRLFRSYRPGLQRSGRTIISMLYIMLVMSLEVWIWATVLLFIHAVSDFETALYFALVCFTTLGFGDITLVEHWRLLSALIAANGFLMFGWSTAFTVELVRRTSGTSS